jgi:hypothetical protein
MMDDYSTGYGDGYIQALYHVQDYISDEDAFWAEDDEKTRLTIFLHQLSAALDAWVDEWRMTNV